MNDYDDFSDLDTAADGGGGGFDTGSSGGFDGPAQNQPTFGQGAEGLLTAPPDFTGSVLGADTGAGVDFGGLFSRSAFSPGAVATPAAAPWWANAGGGLPPAASRLGDLLAPAPKPDLGPPMFPYPAGGDNGAGALPPVQPLLSPSVAQPDAPGRTAQAASSMSLSPAGAAFIKSWEQGPDGGVATRQYPSPEGGADTIGWGHKIQPGEDFSGGIDPTTADRLFDTDSLKQQRTVQSKVKVPLTTNQYDALVSLAYNAPSAFDEQNSELLRRLNQGDYAGAAAELGRWNHIGQKASPGLTARRADETNIFLNGTYSNHR